MWASRVCVIGAQRHLHDLRVHCTGVALDLLERRIGQHDSHAPAHRHRLHCDLEDLRGPVAEHDVLRCNTQLLRQPRHDFAVARGVPVAEHDRVDDRLFRGLRHAERILVR
jgi:hypothetical protein